MTSALRYVGQAAVLVAFAGMVGFFSAAPSFRHFPEGQALLKVSFAHGGARRAECRKRTRRELAEMAANMRKEMDCPRGRVDLRLEIDLDGAPLYQATLPPTGLAGDGPSRVYERFVLPAGRHVLHLRLRDSRRNQGFDHVTQKVVAFAAGQSVAVDFHVGEGFIVR